MKMEVIIPQAPAADFNFDSACTSPYVSAPSSPRQFGHFFYSAPTSPTRISSFYREFNGATDTASGTGGSLSEIPFDWEEKPGVPKITGSDNAIDDGDNTDFAFDFSGQLERTSVSADELFDGGKIKPLKPPPGIQNPVENWKIADSPKSPRRILKEALSPRQKKKELDPFAAALEQTRRENHQQRDPRGRERTNNYSNSNDRRKGTRSLSPLRASDLVFDHQNDQQNAKQSSSSSNSSSNSWYRKWNLKDLLLFRSASEGRATCKEQLKKYALLKRSPPEDVKNSSFRSTDSSGSISSSRRRKGPVSAHELHYTVNRAVSEEMRKKTSLPYRHGLLGCLGFNPSSAVHHQISTVFGSLTRKSSS